MTGGASNLNTARAPLYARLDMRVTFNPKKVTDRWQTVLRYDPASDRPCLEDGDDSGFPLLPSFGVRYRF